MFDQHITVSSLCCGLVAVLVETVAALFQDLWLI